jgi:hypothetical protein
MNKIDKQQIIAAAAAIFTAAALGSTLLSPEQRETVLQLLPTLLAVLGL